MTTYQIGDRVSVKNENTGEFLEGEITFVYANGPWFEVDTDDLNSGMYHRDLISDPAPIRLASLSDHPAAAGFPPGHPPMGR